MIVFWLLNPVVSGLVAAIVRNADPGHMAANRAAEGLETAGDVTPRGVTSHRGSAV